MSKVTGRRDDMLVIRGVNVYPSEVEAVLVAERAVAPHYLLVVDRTGTMPGWWWPASWPPAGRSAPRPRRPSASGWPAEVGAALLQRLGLTTEVRSCRSGHPRVELGKADGSWRTVEHPLPGWL
jgi:phenylacetate-CoA ligase